jgi:hypothetical protein
VPLLLPVHWAKADLAHGVDGDARWTAGRGVGRVGGAVGSVGAVRSVAAGDAPTGAVIAGAGAL